jgi:cytochrome P450
LSRVFEQLAQRPDIQDRLREEIMEAIAGRETLSYDELNGLKLLHAVLKETLRLYVKYYFTIRATLIVTFLAVNRYPPSVKFERT